MEPSNFTANHAKVAQFAAQTMNHAKSVQFLLNPTNPCSPTVLQPFTANLAKFAQFANTQSERREINQLRTNLNKSSIFIFSDSCKTGSSTLLARIPRIPQP